MLCAFLFRSTDRRFFRPLSWLASFAVTVICGKEDWVCWDSLSVSESPLKPMVQENINQHLRGLHYPVPLAVSACPFSTFFIDTIFTVFGCDGRPITLHFSWVLKWILIVTGIVNSHTVVTVTSPFYHSLTLNSCLSSFLTYCAEI